MASEKLAQVRALVSGWQARTDEILKQQLKKRGIGVTDDLYTQMSYSLTEKSGGLFYAEMVMLNRGRMVDMGVGKGVPIERVKIERYRSRGSKRKRMPKKWYSKAFYGRLNDLQGAVGMKVMEEAAGILREAFE